MGHTLLHIEPGDALLLIDVQVDFLPGGRLAVPDGDAVVPVLNRCLAHWRARGLPILATRDWHPPDHCSFRDRGGPWVPHCLAGDEGARFPPTLALPPATTIVSKATTADEEAYSAFTGTDLAARLREAGVGRLVVGGLATEYCVRETVLDALRAGYRVVVLTDATRAIDAGAGRRAEDEMARAGAVLARAADLAP